MLGKMIASHECFLAFGADKLLFARVCSLVAGQFVGSGESSLAVLPFADEGFFASVDALVSLEVTRFEVVFAAARVVTLKDAAPTFA